MRSMTGALGLLTDAILAVNDRAVSPANSREWKEKSIGLER